MDFLDEILIQLQDFSQDLNFQFKELKELDVNFHEKRDSLVALDTILRNHESDFGSCTSHPEEEKFLTQAYDTFNDLQNISDQKINIAVKTRDLIDSVLSKLDKELLEKKEILDDEETLTESRPLPTLQKSTSFTTTGTGIVNGTGMKKKRRSSSLIKPFNTIPITINKIEEETLYCICRLGSFGDMVGCDAADCPIEWFHYSCVGLTEPPRGSWYCPNCAIKLKTPISR